jgi:hypothetical protein
MYETAGVVDAHDMRKKEEHFKVVDKQIITLEEKKKRAE